MSEPGDDAAVRDLKHAYGRLFNEHAADLGRIDALVAALRPIAECYYEPLGGTEPANQWLWVAGNTKLGALRGINGQHVLDARAALALMEGKEEK